MRKTTDIANQTETIPKSITAERYEVKYVLTEAQALAIRQSVDSYVTDDIHAGAHHEYPVVSLYYDAPGLPMYWSSVRGEKNRRKLRVRWYDTGEPSQLFLEVKRRVDRVVGKDRCALDGNTGNAFLQRNAMALSTIEAMGPKDTHGFYEFRDLYERIGCTPRVLVRYSREACVGAHGEPVRLTFDRHLMCSPCLEYASDTWKKKLPWYEVPAHPVVFEVKFTGPFPGWVTQLVRRFHLTSRSVSKYVLAIRELNRQGIFVDSAAQHL